VSAADISSPVSAGEAKALFADLTSEPVVILAISGGPDSMALLALAARWRASLRHGPALIAVTVDHGLRAESAKEANTVKRQARELGVTHRTLRWTGPKPKSGLQEAAREARYHLLSKEAARSGARKVLTAHTLDDQAETILLRLARGSGLPGLAAMTRASDIFNTCVMRPLLGLPKSRLIATLSNLGIVYADDPSNRDPRFTRARLRGVMPVLASEGLSAERLALLARRVRRAEAALEHAVSAASSGVLLSPWGEGQRIVFEAAAFGGLPEEIALRLLGRAITHAGDEGPVELGKLETLYAALSQDRPSGSIRRTLAGALVTKSLRTLVVERAPPRRRVGGRRISALTTSKTGKSEGSPPRLG
jgi:tRNA(Ile)-lysidine synthase